MSESLGTASLELEGDLSKLEKDLAAAKTKAGEEGTKTGKKFSSSMAGGIRKATLPAVAALGLLAVGAKRTIDAASNLNEAQSAVNTTFGESSKQVIDWSKNTQDAFSQVQFLEAAKQFGTFGSSAGLAGDDLNGFSKSLIDAAQDLSSFHNVPIAQALEDMRSGLAGEVEPLRKYGILLNDAALRQQAMRMGLIKTTKDALSPQNKMLASQQLILQKLGPAAGDWARTSGSAANAAKTQAANTEDLNAKLGKGLLPAYKVLQRILLAVTGFMGDHTKGVQTATGVIASLAAAVLLIAGGMKVYRAGVVAVTAAQWLWNAAIAANPIVLIIAGLVALGVALFIAYKKFDKFRAAISATLNWVRRNWKKIAVFISGPFAPLVLLATDAFGIRSKLIGALKRLLSAAKDKAKDIGRAIKNGIVNGAKGLAEAIVGFFRSGINGIIRLWNALRIPGFSTDPLGKFGPTIHTPEINFPNIPTLHSGGIVPGAPGQEVLALLEGGEEVISRDERGRKNVTVNQYFTEPPADPFPWLRKSQFAAQVVYGG
jgi:hypothetical protein